MTYETLLIDAVGTEDLEDQCVKTEAEYLKKRFLKEASLMGLIGNTTEQAEQWLRGLPVNIPHYNGHLEALGCYLGVLDKHSTEQDKEYFIFHYWTDAMPNALISLINKV